MQSIKQTLNSNIKKYNLEEKLKSIQTCKIWERVIGEYVPKALGQTMALGFEKGVLKVAVLSKEFADLIRSYKDRLICAINTYLGRQMVYSIQIEF